MSRRDATASAETADRVARLEVGLKRLHPHQREAVDTAGRDVRFVIHDAPSQSVDAYYQEIGRAGRDDAPATIVLLYRPEDLSLRRFFAARRGVGRAVLLAVGEALSAAADGMTVRSLVERTGLRQR